MTDQHGSTVDGLELCFARLHPLVIDCEVGERNCERTLRRDSVRGLVAFLLTMTVPSRLGMTHWIGRNGTVLAAAYKLRRQNYR